MAASKGDYAHNRGTSPTSAYNAMQFAIEMAKAAMNTCTIVKVTKVSTNGQVAAVGRVSVQPLVQMVDGINQTVDHVNIFNLPYFRLGSGTKAIIMDPKVGDIGVAVFADRDISSVKKNKKVSSPGSGRRFNMADGVYISTCLSDAPETYIRFTDDGKIIGAVGKNSPCEFVVASDHVQMKKNGNPNLHVTVDAASGQLIAGMAFIIAPDPFPND